MRFTFYLLPFTLFLITGCGPRYTYPADSVPKSIEKIAERDDKLKLTARVAGKTVGAMLVVEELVDEKGQIPREIHEKMFKVMQAVTRVALSTDLPLDFCVVYLRDKQGNELIVTRSVDDIKRANADALGIEESFNRTVFEQGKAAPSVSGETPFVMKEVKLEDFLASQIVQRIRFSFTKDSKDESANAFALVDGNFSTPEGRRTFRFSMIGLKTSEDPHANILKMLKATSDVLKGYAFTAFDVVEIQDYLNRLKLVLSRQTLLDYEQNKIKESEILKMFLTESQSIQEAFKLFGFNLPQE